MTYPFGLQPRPAKLLSQGMTAASSLNNQKWVLINEPSNREEPGEPCLRQPLAPASRTPASCSGKSGMLARLTSPGYAVECLLKWAITRRHQCIHLPAEFEIHNLDNLLLEAGLAGALQRERAVPTFLRRWPIVGAGSALPGQGTRTGEADKLYRETSRVYDWIIEQTL